jgi:hypothetical protein
VLTIEEDESWFKGIASEANPSVNTWRLIEAHVVSLTFASWWASSTRSLSM